MLIPLECIYTYKIYTHTLVHLADVNLSLLILFVLLDPLCDICLPLLILPLCLTRGAVRHELHIRAHGVLAPLHEQLAGVHHAVLEQQHGARARHHVVALGAIGVVAGEEACGACTLVMDWS